MTKKVELGTCILQVPLRHPVELAHRVLSAHYLSGGRLRLGVGAVSTKADFDAVGLNQGRPTDHDRELGWQSLDPDRGQTLQRQDRIRPFHQFRDPERRC